MDSLSLIIEKIEEKNKMMCLCYFEAAVYASLVHTEEWKAEKRVLMDSDQKHLIYVIDTPNGWQYVRFPLGLWKQIDQLLVQDQDLMLVTSVTPEGEAYKSFILKDFQKEALDTVRNMRNNANYGEDMSSIVEEHFAQTISQLT